jgi:hypothetical protein
VLVGGDGPTVLDRVLAFGDAWFPNYRQPDTLYGRIDELRARADRPIEVQAIGMRPDPKHFERAEAAGLRRVLTWLPTGGRSHVEPALERWEAAIAEYRGE